MKTVYADVVFVVNLCVDYLLLYITSRILHIKPLFTKMILSAVLGGIYSVIVSPFQLNASVRIVSAAAVCVLMVLFTFGRRQKKAMLKILVVFFLVSMLLGGFITLLQMHFVTGSISLKVMLLSSCIYSFLLPVAVCMFRTDIATKKMDVEITLCGITQKFVLICDSANFLKDPGSLNPVILLCDECRKGFYIQDDVDRHLILVRTASGIDVAEVFAADSVVAVCGKYSITASVGFVKNNYFKFDGCDGILPSSLIDYL